MLVEAATANHQTLTLIAEEPVLRHFGSRLLNESYWRAMKHVRYKPRYRIESEEFNQIHSFPFRPNQNVVTTAAKIAGDTISRGSQSRLPVPSSQHNRPAISSLAHQHLSQWNSAIPVPCLSSLPRSHLALVGVQSVQVLASAAAAALLANAVSHLETIIFPSVVCRPQNLADRLNNMFRDCEYQVDSIAGNRPVYICYPFQELWQERH